MNPTALPGHILSRKARPVLALLKRPLLAGLRIPLLVTSLAWGLSAAPATAQAAGCQFVLGFATLQALGSSDVGNCVDDQAFAANGDALQHTDKGLMVWRKADNWTAFTDGYQTWVNGPEGLVSRLNTQRFSWEAGTPAQSAAVAGIISAINASGSDHPISESVVIPTGR